MFYLFFEGGFRQISQKLDSVRCFEVRDGS